MDIYTYNLSTVTLGLIFQNLFTSIYAQYRASCTKCITSSSGGERGGKSLLSLPKGRLASLNCHSAEFVLLGNSAKNQYTIKET